MTEQTVMLNIIEANLDALEVLLKKATQNTDDALKAVRDGNQNGAVGALIGIDTILEGAESLVQAISIIHRL